jgi:small basic protein
MPAERDSLIHDLARETWDSWIATPRWAQLVLVGGAAVHVVASVTQPPIPYALLGVIRVAAFVAIIVGLIENAKTLDEFYSRVYLEASAIALVLSSVILYAGGEFGLRLGLLTVVVLYATFLIGFVAAFARLRRA